MKSKHTAQALCCAAAITALCACGSLPGAAAGGIAIDCSGARELLYGESTSIIVQSAVRGLSAPSSPNEEAAVVSLTFTNVGTGPVDLPFKGSAVFELLVGPVSGSVPQYAAAMDVVPAAEGKDKLAARETLDVKMYFLIPKGARILALSIERSRSIRMEAEFAGMKSAEVDGFIQAQVNKETTLAMCRSAIYPLVKAMIDMNGFDIDFKGCRGLDPLHIAVLHENLGCVEGLLRDGADPAERAWFLGYEVTPLHLAVFVQNVGAARLLIEAGQDPLMVVGKTASPLEMAIRDGQKDMVELFRMSLR